MKQEETIRLRHLVHVVNSLAPGAIPNILRDLQPELARRYRVSIVALEPITDWNEDLQDLQDNGAEILSLDCPRRNVVMQFHRLRQYLHANHPHVAHGHMGRAEVLTPLAAPDDTFSVATYHNTPRAHKHLTKLLARISNRRLGARTFVSHAVARSWRGEDYHHDHVVYNPVRFDRFEHDPMLRQTMRQELGLTDESFLFLNVARLIPAKGQSDLVHAAARLKARGIRNFQIAIAGEGPLRNSLQELSARLDVTGHLHFLGHRQDVNALLAAADFFVFPSRFEGLGLAPIEAIAHGCPLIIADFLAGREFVTDGETGHVFPIGDIEALTRLMEAGMRDQAGFARLADCARQSVVGQFHAATICEGYSRIYENGANYLSEGSHCP